MSRRRENALDFDSLKKELLRKGDLFVDPQFPPNEKSLFSGGALPSESIHLKRPKELTPDAQFVVSGVNRHDVNQGWIGNCWFVAGASILADTRSDLFERVVPLDQGFEPGRYTGMFRFKFWWFGKWVEIVIDDYLPTNGKRLIYSRNPKSQNEFWACLLEKAYAKLYGSYQALIGGHLNDALVDLTGGISEVIDIEDKTNISPGLYSLLIKSCKMNSLIGASIRAKNKLSTGAMRLANNLYDKHAYSITGFHQVNTERINAKLLRLRNPWGQTEWDGAWADDSDEMRRLPQNIRDDLNFQRTDDGEFWMGFDDFIKNFDAIHLCHFQIDSLVSELEYNEIKQMWYINVASGAWIKGVTAGGCGNRPDEDLYSINPRMTITILSPDVTLDHGDDCTLIVSLMRKVTRDPGHRSDIAIGFSVSMTTNHGLQHIGNSGLPSNKSLTHFRQREVTRRFVVKPGIHVIIVSTFQPHQEAEFLLRAFTERPTAESNQRYPADSAEIPALVPPQDDPMSGTFGRHAGPDQTLDAHELGAFLEDIATAELKDSLKLSVECCRSLISTYSKQKSGYLNLDETKQAWTHIKGYRVVFKQLDVNRSNFVDTQELGALFVKLGFQVNQNFVASIVRRYCGRNNQVSLADFIQVVCKLTSLFATFQEQLRSRPGSGESAEFTRNEFLEATILT